MRRRAPPPYPNLQTPQSLASGTLFRSRWPQLPATPDAGVSEQQIGERQQALSQAPAGEPSVDVDVRSVYDVRPINAYDVIIPTLSTAFDYGTASSDGFSPLIEQGVPLGYVFVLRRLDHYFTVPPAITVRNEALLTLYKNHAGVPMNTDVPVGGASVDLFRTFVIYDEGEIFGAQIAVSTAGGIGTGTTRLGVLFYGNFIRKTGRSANLEIGNPTRAR